MVATKTDATSGVDLATCQGTATYSGPDGNPLSVSRTCDDNAGNTGTGSASFKYDATAPTVTVAFSRATDHNGWFNHAVDYMVATKTDATSGVDLATCQGTATYSGPDGNPLSVSRTCDDNAGNTGTGSASFKYDATAPTVTVAFSRATDHNGWFNHAVDYMVATKTDATSGVDLATCQGTATYSGPDGNPLSVSRTCDDNAGNTGTGSASFKYDATAPTVTVAFSRATDHNGWFNHAVDYMVATKTDATSGVDLATCQGTATYSGPDGNPLSVSRTCDDNAGNTGTGSASFKYDATAPTVTVAFSRATDHNGWFNHAVDYMVATKTDATSGVDLATCQGTATYSGPDGNPLSVSRTCDDNAGNTGTGSASFKYDATAPTVTVAFSRATDHNGWFNHAVDYMVATKTDATSGVDLATCQGTATYSGPDGNPLSVSRTCDDNAGNTGTGSASFKYDATAPTVTVAFSRATDHNGWFNHAVDYMVATKTDATSGVDLATCQGTATYSGPDGNPLSVSRTCDDNAGNTGTGSASFKYDATAPTVTVAFSRATDHNGWFNHAVDYMVATKTDATSGVDLATCQGTATYSGPDGNPLSVSRTCDDNAGNTGTGSASFKYDATAPTVTVAFSRATDHNGWFNHAVDYMVATKTDATSGVDLATCQGTATYSGPDGNPLSVSRTCDDNAGNTGTGSASFKYDATAPTVTVAFSRATDHNGWFNHAVDYMVATKTDATSGVDLATCQGTATYSGPDGNPLSVSRTCDDNAGNTGTGSASFKYDATAPTVTVAFSRATDHNGWFNHAVDYMVATKTDATSGVDLATCQGTATYSGPDGNPLSVSRTCDDNAGNTGTGSASFKYDATAPTVTVAFSRATDHNGWFNHAVDYMVATKTDATSGVDLATCQGTATYSGPDGNPLSVSRTCDDNAGNTGTGSASFKY